MVYFCDRCGYTTKYRNNFRNHLNRKKPCSPSHADIDIDQIKRVYDLSSDEEELLEELECCAKTCIPIVPPGVEDVIKDVLGSTMGDDGGIVIEDLSTKRTYKCGYCLRNCESLEAKNSHEEECEVKREIKSKFYDKKPMPVPEPESGKLWQVQLLNELLEELLETKFKFVDTEDGLTPEEKYLNIMKRDTKTRNKMTEHLYDSILTFMKELRLTEK